MVSTSKIKSVDSNRKIPRNLTSGAGLSIIAAFSMFILFGMELHDYMRVSTTTSFVVDKSSDGDFLRIDFNMSFPALPCEVASVDVSDILETNRLNVTTTVRKYSIDSNLNPTGAEFRSGPIAKAIKHDEEDDEVYGEGSVEINTHNFDSILHQYPILVVKFYAPWCFWSKRLKPSWDEAATIIRERYDPEMDGRILLGEVDCVEEPSICRRQEIEGYPTIRIFRNGSDIREYHGDHGLRYGEQDTSRLFREHESYYGERDTEGLVKAMEDLVAPIEKKDDPKRRAPLTGGCRIEGYVHVKNVPGNLIISARSAEHSFDASQMNMSHVISHFYFGKRITPRVRSGMKRQLPFLGGSHDRLNGLSYISNPRDSSANVTIVHYLQVVKSEVMTSSYNLIEYEYTAQSSLVHSLDIPVAKFHFEPSPMQVLITEDSKSFAQFLTNVCAIIGGVIAVVGILGLIRHHAILMMRKVEPRSNICSAV